MILQRIQTFAKVKKRKELARSMNNLYELQKAFKAKFDNLNLKIDDLERKNEMLHKLNEEINNEILGKIKNIDIESKLIKAER